jgi:hypothetical protein
VSYRDYIEQQRKLARTKKEARELREENLRNPRPPRRDPPPPSGSPLVPILTGLFLILVLGWTIFFLTMPTLQPTSSGPPTIVVKGTPTETEIIKHWLETEIRASNLNWEIVSVETRQELAAHINGGLRVDVLIVEEELAYELYETGLLQPLHDKAELPSFAAAFSPLWNAGPFQKRMGWAITSLGDIEYARHLYTVFQHFAEPLSIRTGTPFPS